MSIFRNFKDVLNNFILILFIKAYQCHEKSGLVFAQLGLYRKRTLGLEVICMCK